MPVAVKSLILDVAAAANGKPIPVLTLVKIAEVFGVTGNAMRVALARLLARGLLERDERGQYRLASKRQTVMRHVASWSHVLERMQQWNECWIGVQTAGLRRSPRAALRRRRRALDFLGFRRLDIGLWIRPDNLRGGAADARERLRELGFEAQAPVFCVSDLDPETFQRALSLWDVTTLRLQYASMREALEESEKRMSLLSTEEIMVESFVLVRRVMRKLAYDPLLPDPILPGGELRGVVGELTRYYDRARGVWHRFLTEHGAPHILSPEEHVAAQPARPQRLTPAEVLS